MTRSQNHIFTKVRTGSQAEALAVALSSRGEPVRMRHIATISQLSAAGMGLRVSCHDCGHEEFFAGSGMEDLFGGATVLPEARTVCSRCGSGSVSHLPEAVD